jgi:predicted Zn-ribbon and HTH transcriptional regulator
MQGVKQLLLLFETARELNSCSAAHSRLNKEHSMKFQNNPSRVYNHLKHLLMPSLNAAYQEIDKSQGKCRKCGFPVIIKAAEYQREKICKIYTYIMVGRKHTYNHGAYNYTQVFYYFGIAQFSCQYEVGDHQHEAYHGKCDQLGNKYLKNINIERITGWKITMHTITKAWSELFTCNLESMNVVFCICIPRLLFLPVMVQAVGYKHIFPTVTQIVIFFT